MIRHKVWDWCRNIACIGLAVALAGLLGVAVEGAFGVGDYPHSSYGMRAAAIGICMMGIPIIVLVLTGVVLMIVDKE